ncbi:hypothetical protein FSHL1_010326 [Fusarium sambucinum]
MARQGIVALLAATILGAGVNASPCKPYSSAALSSTITVEPTATGSSTITAGVTDTTDALETTVTATTEATDTTEVLETTLTESATETTGLETTVIETTAAGTTDLVETTTTEVAIDTTGALEPTTIETTAADTTNVDETTTTEAVVETSAAAVEPTTTAAGPVCVPTQILENTGFDDNNDGSPWILDEGSTISQVNPRSAPNFVYATMSQTRTFTSIIQNLPALGDFTYHLQYSFNLQTAINGRGFSCQVYPSVNQQRLDASPILTDSGPYGFRAGSNVFVPQTQDSPVLLSLAVQCLGNYNTIIIGLDDVTLTRTCNVRD